MTVDPAVVPGFLLLMAELGALAAVGFVVARVALRQTDDRLALAQGLVIGPALWGLIVNFAMYAVPGLAGALVGWAAMLVLGAGLAWRASAPIRPRGRVVAGFVVAALALLWVALASRQLLAIPDARAHLGLAASIRAGGFPPAFFWTPEFPAHYHHGADLLIGLLTPPVGPDLAFVTELLSAYVWMSFVLVVVTALLRRASRLAVAVTVPLLLSAGVWSFIGDPVVIAQVPVPAGLPAAGIRASLTDIYWPSVELPWSSQYMGLPDIWVPAYPLAYALAFVVLDRAAQAGRRSWLAAATLAGLVGFVGLLSTTLAPIVLALWTVLEAAVWWTSRHGRADHRRAAVRAAAGPVLAVLLLAAGSGVVTSALAGAGRSGLSLGWPDGSGIRRPLVAFDVRPGGIGLLGVGPVVVAAVAALLAWRDRLVLALVAGAGALLLAALVLRYEPAPWDLSRFVGHARNFALLALLLALSTRLTDLPPRRWRYAVGSLLVILVTWPTVAEPVRNLSLAVGNGVEIANASPLPQELERRSETPPATDLPAPGEPARQRAPHEGRFAMPFVSARVAAYIRDHTPVDARVFSSSLDSATVPWATGRANAAGFAGHRHVMAVDGPSYRDGLEHLDPAALRRLEIGYVHATDAWVAELPDRAARWLAAPRYFELLIRDDGEALFRVLPEFLRLDAAPAPASFEALRRAVPASATVYLPPVFSTLPRLRVAASLSHARLLGFVDPGAWHVLTPFQVDPLGDQAPDLVIMPLGFVPWMLPPAGRQPIWWNHEVAVYAPDGAVAPIMSPPPSPGAPLPIGVRVSDVHAADGRITFTTTLQDQAPEQWTGQDWVVIAGDGSPWALPLALNVSYRTPVTAVWFAGQMTPGGETTTHTFEFDVPAARLSVWDEQGARAPVASTDSVLGPGAWTLGIRLQHEWQPNYWREAAFIPVLRITVSEAGEVSYVVYEDSVAVRPLS